MNLWWAILNYSTKGSHVCICQLLYFLPPFYSLSATAGINALMFLSPPICASTVFSKRQRLLDMLCSSGEDTPAEPWGWMTWPSWAAPPPLYCPSSYFTPVLWSSSHSLQSHERRIRASMLLPGPLMWAIVAAAFQEEEAVGQVCFDHFHKYPNQASLNVPCLLCTGQQDRGNSLLPCAKPTARCLLCFFSFTGWAEHAGARVLFLCLHAWHSLGVCLHCWVRISTWWSWRQAAGLRFPPPPSRAQPSLNEWTGKEEGVASETIPPEGTQPALPLGIHKRLSRRPLFKANQPIDFKGTNCQVNVLSRAA